MYTEEMLSQNATVADGTLQRSSPRRCRIHEHSETALAMARYSASTLDLDTVFCRLDDHEMREDPRKMQKPEVDRRVSGHPAQSASEYTVIVGVGVARSWTPRVSVPLMYHRMRFSMVWCTSRGACIWRQTYCTAYAMSRRMSVRYCSAPAMLR